jgi:sugar-specific transcriptional regulator TrmB
MNDIQSKDDYDAGQAEYEETQELLNDMDTQIDQKKEQFRATIAIVALIKRVKNAQLRRAKQCKENLNAYGESCPTAKKILLGVKSSTLFECVNELDQALEKAEEIIAEMKKTRGY